MTSASEKYQLMTEMCRIAESVQWDENDCFSFCDNGNTLQINSSLLKKCRTNPGWSEFEHNWENMPDCGIWIPDDEDLWEVA